MSELITQEIFTDGQQDINAANMNGIIGLARIQPDVIANKPASATMDIADQLLVLKTDNTLAKTRFDTIVNSTSSSLPLADATKNGTLRQVSGLATDFVDGTNHCQPLASVLPVIPAGVIWDFAGSVVPTGWLLCDGTSYLRATYPALFTAIGSTYGSVDGTHFNVPDAKGRMTQAVQSGRPLGTKVGSETVTIAAGNLPAHAHPIVDIVHSHTTVTHNHPDPGHVHQVYAQSGTIGVTSGPTQIAYFGSVNTGSSGANLSAAQPNTNPSGTGLSATGNNTGGGTVLTVTNPVLVVNKIIKT